MTHPSAGSNERGKSCRCVLRQIGRFTAYKSGHALNNGVSRALLARPDAWELITFDEPDEVPQAFQVWQVQAA